jgi:hypothetical protein
LFLGKSRQIFQQAKELSQPVPGCGGRCNAADGRKMVDSKNVEKFPNKF